jgi:FG-GAP-like repeat
VSRVVERDHEVGMPRGGMLAAKRLSALAVVVVLLAVAVWWVRRSVTEPDTAAIARDERSAILPPGSPSDFFTPEHVGDPILEKRRPQISNVQVVDLDRDGLPDILVCDVIRSQVTWIRQDPRGTYTEIAVGDSIPAPAHVEAIDVDRDGDLDLAVAGLGVLAPSNNRVGSVVILENNGRQQFINRVVADRIARVADVQGADLDGDGDMDFAVAGFGYYAGETSWLENKGDWTFEQHVLLRLSGPINAIVADINNDGRPDIVSLVSQEWEEIWAFLNDGRGQFTSQMIWGSTDTDFGSSWMSILDFDRDSDLDILYSNGDAFDYAPANSRPWHGVQWLENRGSMQFDFHRLADLPGASSPQAVDVDGDADLDVVVVSAYNNWDDPAAMSLVWLENNGRLQFAMHRIASSPTHLITLAAGDLDGNGTMDLVTGGMHISRPYDRLSRVTVWSNRR